VKPSEILEILIVSKEVLQDLKRHKRISDKLKIAGDFGVLEVEVSSLPEEGIEKEKEEAEKLLSEFKKSLDDDDYISCRKTLDLLISRMARIVAIKKIESESARGDRIETETVEKFDLAIKHKDIAKELVKEAGGNIFKDEPEDEK
jgi:hypothetical protein